MESDNLRAFQLETNQVINDKLLKRLKQEWLTTERRAVKTLTLLMAERILNNINTEIRCYMVKFIVLVIEVTKEPLNRLLCFYARDFLSVPDLRCVFFYRLPISDRQDSSAPFQVRSPSVRFSSPLHSVSSNRQE